MKIFIGLSPQDDKQDILDAYGPELFCQLFPDEEIPCPLCPPMCEMGCGCECHKEPS